MKRNATFGNIGPEWMLRLGIVDQSDKRLNDLVGLCGRLPVLGLDDRQAHLTLLVYVRMVYLCLKSDLGRLERILSCSHKKKQKCVTQHYLSSYKKTKIEFITWIVDLDFEGALVVWRVVRHD